MSAPPRWPFYGTLAALAASLAFVVSHWAVTTDITAFLPRHEAGTPVLLARVLADSPLSRTMILTVGAPDPATARAGGLSLEQALRSDPEVGPALEQLRGGPPAGLERALFDLYHPRRLSFLARTPEEARALLSVPALHKAARRLREQLSQPLSPLLGRLAPSDPLLILPGLFDRLEGAQRGELRVDGGRFVSADGRHAILMFSTRARAFDSQRQGPLLLALDRVFAKVDKSHGGVLTLDKSGINRFAVRSERAITRDIQRVSVLSTAGLALLLWLLFRSPRLVVLAAFPVAAGVVAGMAACLSAFGRMHGVTVAFGASLLGVAIDYVVHLYCHHTVAPDPEGPRGTLRSIGGALVTGAVTTIIGFGALFAAGFGGLSEVALFSSVGIAAALIVTMVVVPVFLPAEPRAVVLRTLLVAQLDRGLVALHGQVRGLWLLPLAAFALTIVGLLGARLDTDFMGMDRLDPGLVAEDARVHGRVARLDSQRFAVALADDEDAALAINGAIGRVLDRAQADGVLGGYRSVRDLLPPAATQRAVREAVVREPQLAEHLRAAFEAEGFRPEAFAPFLEALEASAPEPLRFSQLAHSKLASLVAPFRLEVQGKPAFVTFLRDVRDPSALSARLSAIDGAHFVSQGEQLRSLHDRYQRRTVAMLGYGLLGVLAVLLARYRSLVRTTAAFVPPVLAAGVTLAAVNLSGYKVNLVVLMALLMVVSMGVDYGVFLIDADASKNSDADRPAAMLSISVAAVTTVLGFGLLAVSEHPLLGSIGLTATVGMLASLVLAPTSLMLLRRMEGHAP